MGETSEKDSVATPDSPTSSSSTPSASANAMSSPVSFHWKYISLVVLVFQNTALVLTMRYSRTIDGTKYLASTAVVLSELLKLTTSALMELQLHNGDVQATLDVFRKEILENLEELVKISVPSVLYTIQNNLLYVALSHLDAATFQVTYQLKILTTALFAVLILRKKLDKVQWLSLVILTVAVALVQLPSGEQSDKVPPNEGSLSSAVIGLVSVLLACVSSGFSGVYIEKILKGSETSMWIRNMQLSLLSLVFGMFGVFVTDWNAVMDQGFFQGYSLLVGVVICLQALGGLIVAAVMKYADNILKGFATAVSIVFSSIVSYFFLMDFHPSWPFLFGTLLVLLATFLYGWPQRTQRLTSVLPVGSQNTPKGLSE